MSSGPFDNLRDAGVMEPHALYALPAEELAELIRPAGYFQVKARRLRNLLKFVVDEYDGSLDAMFRTLILTTLREQLLAIHGIGPETADAILLYAGGLPTFVVDTYTHRSPRPPRLDRLRRRLPRNQGAFRIQFAGRRGALQ